jgi:DNA-binding NarL/FixJ family response regulator
LGVRERTVTTHLSRIYRKLGAGSRMSAVVAARHAGLLSIGETR